MHRHGDEGRGQSLHLLSLMMRRMVCSQDQSELTCTEASSSLNASLASSCMHGHRSFNLSLSVSLAYIFPW